ncbi:MAG: hypothetical protein PHP79_03110 [Clostridia bacterium]|nr:hypothetical protein [Clostridia bacterium]
MPNPKDYYCEDCDVMYEFCKLVDAMHKDIQHLESEIVRTRYELIRYLDTPYNEYLQSDILSNLAARYYDYPAYESYVKYMCGNQYPMESDEWVDHILKLAHGHESNKY